MRHPPGCGRIASELRRHAPFTLFGSLTGALIAVALVSASVSRSVSVVLFWSLHPLHVLLSGMATTGMYRAVGGRGRIATLVVGYVGAVGIAALSDCVIPYLGEWLLQLPNRGLHLGFIEKWWLVNPAAVIGTAIGGAHRHTRWPHAGHVLVSTGASLFHILMACGTELAVPVMFGIALFLFLSVWVPCCTSDIVFPLLVARGSDSRGFVI